MKNRYKKSKPKKRDKRKFTKEDLWTMPETIPGSGEMYERELEVNQMLEDYDIPDLEYEEPNENILKEINLL